MLLALEGSTAIAVTAPDTGLPWACMPSTGPPVLCVGPTELSTPTPGTDPGSVRVGVPSELESPEVVAFGPMGCHWGTPVSEAEGRPVASWMFRTEPAPVASPRLRTAVTWVV